MNPLDVEATGKRNNNEHETTQHNNGKLQVRETSWGKNVYGTSSLTCE